MEDTLNKERSQALLRVSRQWDTLVAQTVKHLQGPNGDIARQILEMPQDRYLNLCGVHRASEALDSFGRKFSGPQGRMRLVHSLLYFELGDSQLTQSEIGYFSIGPWGRLLGSQGGSGAYPFLRYSIREGSLTREDLLEALSFYLTDQYEERWYQFAEALCELAGTTPNPQGHNA